MVIITGIIASGGRPISAELLHQHVPQQGLPDQTGHQPEPQHRHVSHAGGFSINTSVIRHFCFNTSVRRTSASNRSSASSRQSSSVHQVHIMAEAAAVEVIVRWKPGRRLQWWRKSWWRWRGRGGGGGEDRNC